MELIDHQVYNMACLDMLENKYSGLRKRSQLLKDQQPEVKKKVSEMADKVFSQKERIEDFGKEAITFMDCLVTDFTNDMHELTEEEILNEVFNRR